MTLNQLIYFCKLAETQHYGRAARALFIAQPSLSKAMSLLEKELEVTLFSHHGRNVELSAAGKTFYTHVKPGLEQIMNAREVMRQYTGSQRLPVIGCISPAITSVLAPIMSAYRMEVQSFPRVSVRVDTSEALVEALRGGECDLALCTRIPDTPDVTFVPVASFPFVVVMREDDPLACFESIRPEQLRDRPMAFTNAAAYNEILMRVFARYGLEPLIHSYANDDAAMFGLVCAGAAVFITSDYPQLYSHGIAVRRLEQDVCLREFSLAYTERSLLNPAIKDLIDFSLAYCKSSPLSMLQKTAGEQQGIT